MKNILFALGIFIAAQSTLLAQATAAKPLKIGYTNVEYILGLHPKSKEIQSKLETYKKQLDDQLQIKIQEFSQKKNNFEKGAAMMNEVARADAQKSLENMYGEIEEFQKNAEASMQKKQSDLLKPLLDDVQVAIDKVAEENGYTYILSTDGGLGTTPFILYAPENENVSDMILKKLGITPPPADGGK